MKSVRDVYQRKIYALTRMNQALGRLKTSTNEIDRVKALAWVNAWLAASGLRQFKIGPKARKQPPSNSSSSCS